MLTVTVESAVSDLHRLELRRQTFREIQSNVVAQCEPLLKPACPSHCLRRGHLHGSSAHRTAVAPRAPVERMWRSGVQQVLLRYSNARTGRLRMGYKGTGRIWSGRRSWERNWCRVGTLASIWEENRSSRWGWCGHKGSLQSLNAMPVMRITSALFQFNLLFEKTAQSILLDIRCPELQVPCVGLRHNPDLRYCTQGGAEARQKRPHDPLDAQAAEECPTQKCASASPPTHLRPDSRVLTNANYGDWAVQPDRCLPREWIQNVPSVF